MVPWRLSLALAIGMLALAPGRPGAAEAKDAEPALEVDLGPQATEAPTTAPTPAPTAAPSTAVATVAPTAGTSASGASPTAQGPTPAASPEAASPTAKAGQDLGEVRFDKGQTPEGEDGLMIIAPGAATAEDSLESFGIDSPFNWKNKDKEALQPGKAVAGEEDLELAAPESSDLKDRVRVETGEGTELPTDADYDKVERAGLVVDANEYRVDGRLARTKDGQYFARRGTQVALRMEPGRQVYPGSIYTVFREHGLLRHGAGQQQDVGLLIRNVGVLKVIRIEGEEVLARVEKQYETIREGDLVHLRDPDRLRYYNSARQGAANLSLDLQGEVVGVAPPSMVANQGDVVYLDLGRSKGLAPGVKLTLFRPAGELGRDELRDVKVTGRMGQVQVVNVSRDSCVARVIRSSGEVRIGDRVRYR